MLAAVSLRDLVERRGVRLKRNGSRQDWWGCCPFHGERTPSFVVHEAKGTYHCFGCGAHGSAFDLVMELDRVDFREAVRRLADGRDLPDAAQVARQLRERAAEEAEADRAKEDAAAAMWRSARPIEAGDLADCYLRYRGLTPPAGGWWPASLRLGRWVSKAGRGHDALLSAATRWPDRRVVGLQATPLKPPGVKKFDQPLANGRKMDKLEVGRRRGAAVRLAPWSEGAAITLTEGVESGLAVLQADPAAVVWACLGTANVTTVQLPEACPVRLVLDGDKAGHETRWKAARLLVEAGRAVTEVVLPDGLDPLDVLVKEQEALQLA